jgi:saccharopine dehydrogenase-like NADP-dependent oxidoreductase
VSVRIFALGGAGVVGSECVRALLAHDDVAAVTIGELDAAKAHALAERLGDRRVTVAEVDVADTDATAALVAGHDVLVSTLFWASFGDALAVACRAGVDYADVLSHPTAAHRRMALAAGITAVSGLGASPGIGNVLGRKACDAFEEPLELEISCTSFRPVAPSEGLLDTLLAILSPELPERGYHFLGRFVPTRPLEGAKVVDFGPPVGELMVYYINHTETFTFPVHFPSLRYVAVRGTYRPKLMEDFAVLGAYGLLDDVVQATPAGPVRVRDVVRDRIWATWGGRTDDDADHLYLHVRASGTSAGRDGTATWLATHPIAWRERSIGRMTGVGAAVGTVLLARQGGGGLGIVDPERFYDPDEFLSELTGRHGVRVQGRVDWDEASARP